jgi:hypothetical protein
MVNSEHPEHPSDVIEAIILIAKNTFIRLTGLWHLTPTGSIINFRPENYDYLIQVRDANYLIHPDDMGSITFSTSNKFRPENSGHKSIRTCATMSS